MIEIKSEHEIVLIEEAGNIVKKALDSLSELSEPGITTAELDRQAEALIKSLDAQPAFKGYKGFPATICTSINEQIVHGIPGKRKLRPGDVLSIDMGVKKNGFFADSAVTIGIGKEVADKAKHIIEITKRSLEIGIKKAVAGSRLFDISHAIQSYVEGEGYSVVRDFVGHGIGRNLHEEPEIPNFGKPGVGPRLKKGMVLALEPMVNEGTYEIEVLEDGWTAVTKDKSLSAHFEHTIVVTDNKPRILT